MCIFVYFGYTPPPKTGSVRETESPGNRGRERFGGFFGIRKARAPQKHPAATSACFSARGHSLESRPAALRPRPGAEPGHSLACSRDFKQSRVVSQRLEADGAQNPSVKKEQEGQAWYPEALQKGPFHAEPGNQRPEDVCHRREANRGPACTVPSSGRWRRLGVRPPKGKEE